jgi:hypothetical protein
MGKEVLGQLREKYLLVKIDEMFHNGSRSRRSWKGLALPLFILFG